MGTLVPGALLAPSLLLGYGLNEERLAGDSNENHIIIRLYVTIRDLDSRTKPC